jgi:hypothetical protein
LNNQKNKKKRHWNEREFTFENKRTKTSVEAFCASIDEQIEEKKKKKGSQQLTQPICNRFLIANNNARRWLDSSSLALKRIRGDCCKGPQTDRYVGGGGGGGGGGGTIESSSGSIRREVRLLRLSQSHTRERLSLIFFLFDLFFLCVVIPALVIWFVYCQRSFKWAFTIGFHLCSLDWREKK